MNYWLVPSPKELSHITHTQFIAEAAHQYMKVNVGGNFDEIEWRAGSLVTILRTKLGSYSPVGKEVLVVGMGFN